MPKSPESAKLPAEFLSRLRASLPPESLRLAADQRRPFETDGLTLFRELPGAVVLPANESEVVVAVNLCREANIPLVARGAGTGLSGGATPRADGVVLGLSRLNRILEINPLARTARVQPGVRNLQVSEAASPHGLFYAPDPSSQPACSIGGNVAENSGGVRCLKYGLTVNNVIKLRAVLASGEVAEFGCESGDAPGLDLLALMHGGEGLLAIVTEALLKLTAKPETARAALASFDSLEDAGNAVADIIASGVTPSGLEMMDALAARAAESFANAGYPTDCAALLIVETDGRGEEAERDMQKVAAVLKKNNARETRLAKDDAERELFWRGRKAAFPAVGRLYPDYYCMDGTIPRKRLGETLKSVAALAEKHDLACANVFHAGDGNLHPLILFDDANPGELERARAFGSDILKLCLDAGGTITGEHGVGIEKINEMCLQFPPAELERFREVKRAFDPGEFLNPGKAVPTLHRCAEFGMMHVRRGEERFADLPRF